MSELKKCPFCGGDVSIALGGDCVFAYWFVTHGKGENKCKCRMESEQFNKDSEESDVAKGELIAAWNRRADGWIPVSERLPEVGKCVLIQQTYHAFIGEHGEYEGVTIGYLHQPADRRCKPYFYYAAVSDYGDMVRAQSICPGSEFVTHWMPLPAQPKGE